MKAKARIRIARPRRRPRGLGHERRGEILAAAKQLFLKQGYENFTTRKLAARVGLSQTGVYVYFKSKEEILDAVCRSTFEGLALRIRAVSAESKNSPDAIRRLLEAYVDFGLQHPDEYQLTFMVGNSAPKFTRRKDLSRPFKLQGIGIALPPSYLEHLAQRFPLILARLAQLDRRLGRLPLLGSIGDCVLLQFERTEG